MKNYLSTTSLPRKATTRGLVGRAIAAALSKLDANPDYVAYYENVCTWFIEFDNAGFPEREVGFTELGEAVVAGPDRRNYGFWVDTNCMFADLPGQAISSEAFERAWRAFFEAHPERIEKL